MSVTGGFAHSLGALWDGSGTNFALFSEHAERVELCLYDDSGRRELARLTLPDCTNNVWHGFVPGCRPGTRYGYRVHGPYDPERGHRFNPNKLLIDPYARLIDGELRWSDSHLGYKSSSPREDLSFDRRDNSRVMPKSVVVDPAFSWGDDRRPQTHMSDTVFYECHVGGFTILHEGIDESIRGSYAAMADPLSIAHLKSLGITSVELMPVHHFVDDRFLVDKGLRNYWGYSTLNYFAPEQRYFSALAASSGPSGALGEVKQMVRRFHDAGIEVILDVVYNHSCEGDHRGPTLSFKGIDNHSYYRLSQDNKRYYINDTGCGNTLNLCHPRVLQMVMDSLRYWVTDMHVDGFRFDLATSLAREPNGFDIHGGFLDAVQQDPVLAQVKLIAEPWDIGPGGYQLGAFPAGWSEWNDRYRDTLRRYWRGDDSMLPELARRVHGSSDVFDHSGRGAWSSVNFVTTHDGFTLLDTVSYRDRHNEANGENNADGHHANFSDNYGEEGPTDDNTINAFRDRQRRNMLATLMLSQGVPLLLAGDEMGRTQQGNNNAYCQDNEINHVDWSLLDSESEFYQFVCRLMQLRHEEPLLRQRRFVHAPDEHDASDAGDGVEIRWLNPAGDDMTSAQWGESFARCVGLLLTDRQTMHRLLMIFNASRESIEFKLPSAAGSTDWLCRLNTAHVKATDAVPEATAMVAVPTASVTVAESSVLAYNCYANDEAQDKIEEEAGDGANGSTNKSAPIAQTLGAKGNAH
jgi:glycogen operon protein